VGGASIDELKEEPDKLVTVDVYSTVGVIKVDQKLVDKNQIKQFVDPQTGQKHPYTQTYKLTSLTNAGNISEFENLKILSSYGVGTYKDLISFRLVSDIMLTNELSKYMTEDRKIVIQDQGTKSKRLANLNQLIADNKLTTECTKYIGEGMPEFKKKVAEAAKTVVDEYLQEREIFLNVFSQNENQEMVNTVKEQIHEISANRKIVEETIVKNFHAQLEHTSHVEMVEITNSSFEVLGITLGAGRINLIDLL
jgi:hypothetical protein